MCIKLLFQNRRSRWWATMGTRHHAFTRASRVDVLVFVLDVSCAVVVPAAGAAATAAATVACAAPRRRRLDHRPACIRTCDHTRVLPVPTGPIPPLGEPLTSFGVRAPASVPPPPPTTPTPATPPTGQQVTPPRRQLRRHRHPRERPRQQARGGHHQARAVFLRRAPHSPARNRKSGTTKVRHGGRTTRRNRLRASGGTGRKGPSRRS